MERGRTIKMRLSGCLDAEARRKIQEKAEQEHLSVAPACIYGAIHYENGFGTEQSSRFCLLSTWPDLVGISATTGRRRWLTDCSTTTRERLARKASAVRSLTRAEPEQGRRPLGATR